MVNSEAAIRLGLKLTIGEVFTEERNSKDDIFGVQLTLEPND